MSQTLVVKVGTKVLTNAAGDLDLLVINALAGEIAALKRDGHRIVLVSSGAVGAGRPVVQLPPGLPETPRRQVYAAVGQARLMALYGSAFAKHGLVCAQVLATKEDFRDQAHYFNMRSCFENVLRDNIIPVVNENDVVAVSELLFTDNDELAGLVASMLAADTLLILSSIEGLLGADGRVITEITPDSLGAAAAAVRPGTSSGGRGGMMTKFAIAKKLMAQGIEVRLGSGHGDRAIMNLRQGEAGTLFRPAAKMLKAGKRRLAHSDGLVRGAVTVDAAAAAKLASGGSVSLLPVGVTRVAGTFRRGDVVEILDPSGNRLGFGRAETNHDLAAQNLGRPNAGTLIHYDHMFIE